MVAPLPALAVCAKATKIVIADCAIAGLHELLLVTVKVKVIVFPASASAAV